MFRPWGEKPFSVESPKRVVIVNGKNIRLVGRWRIPLDASEKIPPAIDPFNGGASTTVET
jgi:hypothetical protein